jgi:tetratricopeptide (TPR) repeat protein
MKERRLIHEKIGMVMEELLHDHLPEFYETLAYHYSQSDNFPKAYEYLKLSGEKALKNYANNEAIRFYKEAIRMLDTQPESLENKKKKLAVALKMIAPLAFLSYPEGSLEIFQYAEKLAQELGNEEGLVLIHANLSLYYTVAGNPSLGLEYGEKSFNSAEKIKDFGLIASSATQICAAHWFTGDVVKIVDIGGRAIHLLEDHHLEKDFFGMGFSGYSFICMYCGLSLGWMGRFKEGEDIFEKGFRNACEVNDKFMMGMTQLFHSMLMHVAGDGDKTISLAQEAIKIFKEAEISLAFETAWMMLGGGYYLCGELDKAIEAGEKSLSLAKENGMPFMICWSYCLLAMTLRAAGDLRRAKECAEESLRISQECNAKSCEGISRVLLGCMVEEITPAIIEEAQRQVKNGISILEDCKIKSYSAIGYLHLGEFLANAGRKEEAVESLKKAEALYQEMEVTPQSYWLTRTKDAIKKLGSAAGAAK